METETVVYLVGAVTVGALLIGGLRDGHLAWYNVLAGALLWPITLAGGLMRARDILRERRSAGTKEAE